MLRLSEAMLRLSEAMLKQDGLRNDNVLGDDRSYRACLGKRNNVDLSSEEDLSRFEIRATMPGTRALSSAETLSLSPISSSSTECVAEAVTTSTAQMHRQQPQQDTSFIRRSVVGERLRTDVSFTVPRRRVRNAAGSTVPQRVIDIASLREMAYISALPSTDISPILPIDAYESFKPLQLHDLRLLSHLFLYMCTRHSITDP
ncbi:hypothetical protein FA95DRAFT_1565471 [Auriscalpium vulgare]|uniref:Uncharacterized protein n=1 Tax=Auriscalpium vulgare TaxID=40419 RepID=A0ACB8RBI2_9AGAM|nr:hypothetical protein FA95DRAFT_1565471 [Auriscalpium vulgare]